MDLATRQKLKKSMGDRLMSLIGLLGSSMPRNSAYSMVQDKNMDELYDKGDDSLYAKAFEEMGESIPLHRDEFVIREPLNQGKFKEFREKSQKLANDYDQLLQTGVDSGDISEEHKQFIQATTTKNIKRTIRGYGDQYLATYTPLSLGLSALGPVINTSASIAAFEQGQKQWRKQCPVHDLMIQGERQMETLADYFSEREKGPLSRERETIYRRRLYSETLKMLDDHNRVCEAVSDPDLQQPLRNIFQNDPFHIHPKAMRGTIDLQAGLDAYKMGLENGWSITDLGMLAQFNVIKEQEKVLVTTNRSVDFQSFKELDTPKYRKKGQKEFIQQMDDLYKEIKETKLDSPDKRTELMTRMGDMVKEGREKGFFGSKDDASYKNTVIFDMIKGRAEERNPDIAAGKDPAIFNTDLSKMTRSSGELKNAYALFNTKRTDKYIGSEGKEHQELTKSAALVLKGTETLRLYDSQQVDLTNDVKKQNMVRFYHRQFGLLDKMIKDADTYLQTHKNPKLQSGKDRKTGAEQLREFAIEERRRLVDVAEKYGLVPNGASIETARNTLTKQNAEYALKDIREKYANFDVNKINHDTAQQLTSNVADVVLADMVDRRGRTMQNAIAHEGTYQLKMAMGESKEFKNFVIKVLRDAQKGVKPNSDKREERSYGDVLANNLTNNNYMRTTLETMKKFHLDTKNKEAERANVKVAEKRKVVQNVKANRIKTK